MSTQGLWGVEGNQPSMEPGKYYDSNFHTQQPWPFWWEMQSEGGTVAPEQRDTRKKGKWHHESCEKQHYVTHMQKICKAHATASHVNVHPHTNKQNTHAAMTQNGKWQSTEKILNLDSRFNKLYRAVYVIVNHFTVLIKDVDKLNVHMKVCFMYQWNWMQNRWQYGKVLNLVCYASHN